ncbi:GNAT family N-acetyltransferase [Advenella sp. FME57]|uniref:GNAT family N-acetyltransferase n=1 Tax=Advenella kashmirensis TaxID=310575 RepID=A0A356LH24_9BURK|nr:GNAT family N-acetyltransferase [Advenella sp. FME57]HBP30068.1 GNAT family N-acetyltransferase [Advenella kashmirensis]
MTKHTVEITNEITEEMSEIIGAGLNAYNDEITKYNDRKSLAIVVRDKQSGQLIGGMLGRSSLGLLFIELVYLPEELRNSGLGSTILKQFEQEGRNRGCSAAVLYTISFQAPGFYEKHGWERFGEIPCSPPGTSRIFLTKKL